jgi:beta-lactam-binding protein with PASTA domain
MPPKVKMLPVNEIVKLIASHNKLSKITMPKGKERTRPNLIKAIEDAGFKLNHEKKRIEKGAERGSRVKTDPKKDASKDPKKITMSIKPPMASMKIKPKSSKPKNMKQLRDQVKDILKPVPARVKQFKKEGASLTSFKKMIGLVRISLMR